MNRFLTLVGLRRDPAVAYNGPAFASPLIFAAFVVVAILIVVGLNRLF